jgi:glucose-1-phosphate cytidylyltransferase
MDDATPVVILCGGRGTRLQEHTSAIPKPLVEIGGEPIVWHVIQLYAAQGLRRFLLCTGYKRELIEGFVAGHDWGEGIEVSCIDTGPDTPTGGRIKLVEEQIGARPFHATYADGVADIDLAELVAQHTRHGALATMTVVQPELQFGVTQLDASGERVVGFREKPRLDEWINGGFFYFEPQVLSYLAPDSVLERDPLERLAADGQLHAHRHDGFWDCMDTYKDAVLLNDLWESGAAPWRVWDRAGGLSPLRRA